MHSTPWVGDKHTDPTFILSALKALVKNATNQTQFLQSDKKKAVDKPQNDPEFKRLVNRDNVVEK